MPLIYWITPELTGARAGTGCGAERSGRSYLVAFPLAAKPDASEPERREDRAENVHRRQQHTGGDAAWGRPDYATEAPYLTEAGARWLAEHGARLVGIDSVNVDDLQGGGHRPAHSILLRAGIPVVEHLTGLGQLPPTGFWFTAAPVAVEGFGTFPVRAYATVPG